LTIGDHIIAGTTWCKVRSMKDDRGNSVLSAGPSTPVEVTGWKDLPMIGDEVITCNSEVKKEKRKMNSYIFEKISGLF
jgi:translation initiation factor IF-2